MRRHCIGVIFSILGTVLGFSLVQTTAVAVGPEREMITFRARLWTRFCPRLVV